MRPLFPTMLLLPMVLQTACAGQNPQSLCDARDLVIDRTYEFAEVAIYSDGHTNLAFDYNEPKCEPVAFELASGVDMEPIWAITSRSTQNSTIGAVGNIIAKIEKYGPENVRLKIVGAGEWKARNITLHLQAPLNGMPQRPRSE